MKKLKWKEELEIRNSLDHIGANLYHNIITYPDAAWMYRKMKHLLYIIDEFQQGMEDEDDGTKT